MFTHKKNFIPLSLLFFSLFAFLFVLSLPNAESLRTRSSSVLPLNLKVSPSKIKMRAGKKKIFSVRNSSNKTRFRAEDKNRNIIWFVNGIKWGNKEVGRIDKKGRYRAPKNIASKKKAVISFKLVPDLKTVINPAKVKIKPAKSSNGRLLLQVKWKNNRRSARAEQVPSDVMSVLGVAKKEDSPGKGTEFTAGPVNFSQSRKLVFNVPIGTYTIFLKAFDQENGKGNIIFEGIKSGVSAVETGGSQSEPEPVVIFLTRKDFAPSVSISPDSEIVRVRESKRFDIEVSGVITDVGNPVSLFVLPKSDDLKSKLKDFFSSSNNEKNKLLNLWETKYGTISKGGLYEAPKKVPSKKAIIAIILKSSIDDDKSGFIFDFAEVKIIPKLSVKVSPPNAELNLGKTQQFSATVDGAISDTSVVWSIVDDDSTLGTIDSNGLYSAPSIMPVTATIKVSATSVEDNTAFDNSKVVLIAPSFNVSLVAPEMPMGSIYNLVAISTTGDFSNGAFSDPLNSSQELTISDTLEVKFTSKVSSGWDAIEGRIVDVRTNRLLIDIPDGLPFGACSFTVGIKGSSNISNPLNINILPPFYETLDATNIGSEDTTRGICTDKLHDGSGDFYVTSRSAQGPGDVTMISPSGSQTLLSDKVEDVRGLEINENGDLFVAEILEESSGSPFDRLIKISAGSDTPITGFLTTVDEARGVAIDPDGNVYIADKYNGEVIKFSPSGGTGSIIASVSDDINGIDFNSNGDLFITEDDGNTVYKAPAGGGSASVFATLTHWGSTGVAVDYRGNVFIGERSDYIEIFDPNGNSLGELDYSKLDELEGLELDLCNNIYALNRDSEVIRFTAPPLPTDAPTIGAVQFDSFVSQSGNDFIVIEISGTSFNTEIVATINGNEVATKYVNEKTVKALVPASSLAKAGNVSVFLTKGLISETFVPMIFESSNKSNTINFPIPKAVFISPENMFVPQSQTQQFTAYVTGTDNQSVDWEVKGGSTGGTITSGGLYTAPSLIPSSGMAEVGAISKENSSVKNSVNVQLANLFGTVTDVQTQSEINGATVSVLEVTSSPTPISSTATSDVNGNYAFGLPLGEYSLLVTKSGYQNYSSSLFVDYITSTLQVNPPLSPTGQSVGVGSVSGKVTDENSNPIDGGVVTISGGSQTNGVFATAETDSNGFYTIGAIPVVDTLSNPIPVFTVTAFADLFMPLSQTGISVMANTNTSNIDFSLMSESGEVLIFADSFETTLPAIPSNSSSPWSVVISDTVTTDTISWQRTQNPSSIVNSAVPTYVTLPPGDTSGGALPSPATGSWVMWFGDSSSGNYMGKQVTNDDSLGGGTSDSPDGHAGAIISPYIQIPSGTNPKLSFKSWFEIEGQEPNENGFDKMRVLIASGSSLGNPITGEQVLLLNPFADPVVNNRDDKPYTSAGFNKTPIWVPYTIDLSAYDSVGWIKIVFVFDTEDDVYNAFRGWMIDDVKIVVVP